MHDCWNYFLLAYSKSLLMTFWQAEREMRIETRAEWNIFFQNAQMPVVVKHIGNYLHPQYIARHVRSMSRGFCQEGNLTLVMEFLLLCFTIASSVSPSFIFPLPTLLLFVFHFSPFSPTLGQSSLTLFIFFLSAPPTLLNFFHARYQISAELE